MKVAVIMGSKSDEEAMLACIQTLKDFGIETEARIYSAHRTPQELAGFLDASLASGLKIVIAAAGLAAHLAGVIAAHVTIPVIGVPMDAGPLRGHDALLSMVQMPPGIPVATMAIGKPGAINAALLAVQILATADQTLDQKMKDYRKSQKEKVLSQKVGG